MAKSKMILEEWAADWFHTHAEGKLASNTEVGYRNLIFNHIIPKLGSVALTELSEKRIRAFYRKLSSSGLNNRSVWCVHLLLRRILDECDTFAYKHYSTGNKALWAIRPSSAKNAGLSS